MKISMAVKCLKESFQRQDDTFNSTNIATRKNIGMWVLNKNNKTDNCPFMTNIYVEINKANKTYLWATVLTRLL